MADRFLVTMGPDRMEVLRAVSASTGVSMAELVRQGVDMFIAQRVSGSVCSGTLQAGGTVTVVVSQR